MPKFLEKKLKAGYPNNPHAVYGTMNAIGAMHGSKETAKGAAMEKKHVADHLHTPHREPHPGKKIDGTPYDGKLAGNSTPHEHDKVTHHYEKGKGH
jgi:hypothetical protein